MLFYGTMRELSDFLAFVERTSIWMRLRLLWLDRIPGSGHRAALVDSGFLRRGARRRLRGGANFVLTANQFCSTAEIIGNKADYYDPANSCLNEVLARKTGIPITLSLFIWKSRGAWKMPVFGIGLPGHFLLQLRWTGLIHLHRPVPRRTVASMQRRAYDWRVPTRIRRSWRVFTSATFWHG